MFYTVNSVVMIWMKLHHLKMLHVFVLYSFMYYKKKPENKKKTFLAVYSLLLFEFSIQKLCLYKSY